MLAWLSDLFKGATRQFVSLSEIFWKGGGFEIVACTTDCFSIRMFFSTQTSWVGRDYLGLKISPDLFFFSGINLPLQESKQVERSPEPIGSRLVSGGWLPACTPTTANECACVQGKQRTMRAIWMHRASCRQGSTSSAEHNGRKHAQEEALRENAAFDVAHLSA